MRVSFRFFWLTGLLCTFFCATQLQAKLNALPIAFYSTETSVAFGGALTLSSLKNPQNNLSSLGYVTLKGQYQFSVNSLFTWNEEKWRLEGDLSFSRTPNRFYSPGPDSSSDYGHYTLRKFGARAQIQYRFKNWHIGPNIGYSVYRSIDIEPAADQNPHEWTGFEQASTFGIGCSLTQDRRDHPNDPRRGHFTRFQVTQFLAVSFAFSEYTEFKVDHHRYLPINKWFSFAGAVHFHYSIGDTPYHCLPSFGDQGGSVRLMRGYYNDRYRDRCLTAWQNELRFLISSRWTAQVFVDVGQVSASPGAIRLRNYRTTIGLGIGFFIDKNVRLPIFVEGGFSKEGPAFGVKPKAAF